MPLPTLASAYRGALATLDTAACALAHERGRVETLLAGLRALLPEGVRVEACGHFAGDDSSGAWFHIVLTAERRNAREDVVLSRPVAQLTSSADLTEARLVELVSQPTFAAEVRLLEGVAQKTREYDAFIARCGLGWLAATVTAVTVVCLFLA